MDTMDRVDRTYHDIYLELTRRRRTEEGMWETQNLLNHLSGLAARLGLPNRDLIARAAEGALDLTITALKPGKDT